MQLLTVAPAADPCSVPLLSTQVGSASPATSSGHAPRDGRAALAEAGAAAKAASQAANGPGLGFPPRFWSLLCLLRPYHALLLSVLSILESIVVAEVGKVAGSFYLIVVDRQAGMLLKALLHAAALYSVSAALWAASTYVTGWLALRWRDTLAHHLHRRYCAGAAFLRLQQPHLQAHQAGQAEAAGWRSAPDVAGTPCSSTSSSNSSSGVDSGGTYACKPGPAVDNPDQRMTADTATLCDSLAEVTRVAAAVPVKLCYYSWLTWGYVGCRGLLMVYAFFLTASALQRLAMAPVARLIFRLEAREGDLRSAHSRLREFASEAAQWGAGPAERRALDSRLAGVLAVQRVLVRRYALLAAATRGVDYAGALLNYVVVAAAIFAGAADTSSGGQVAQFVSNASFVTLSLIYTLTELLDLADKLSRMGGLTARVGQLREALQQLERQASNPVATSSEADSGDAVACKTATLLPQQRRWGWRHQRPPRPRRPSLEQHGRELAPAELAVLLQPPQLMPALPAYGSSSSASASMEVSVHQLSPALAQEVRAVFPDAPASSQPLLAAITFQFAAGGISLAPDSSALTLESAGAEQDRMLSVFLRWQAAVAAALAADRPGPACNSEVAWPPAAEAGRSSSPGSGARQHGGWWCDAVDPRTGMALVGSRGARWSEVAAAHALLGYERRDAGICPVVLHPVHGSSAYPATLFSDAPFPVLQRAMAAAAAAAVGPTPQALPGSLPAPAPAAAAAGAAQASSPAAHCAPMATLENGAPLLLALEGLTVRTPAGRLAVEGLSLRIHARQHLLIAGPNGCGKSTLLRTLCSLHPAEAGSIQLLPAAQAPDPSSSAPGQMAAGPAAGSSRGLSLAEAVPSGVMFVPQRPLAAPGPTLWQQLVYPSLGPRPTDAHLSSLLSAVGLSSLLERTGSAGFDVTAAWGAQLSPGELQRLAFARVLHARPALAILDEPTAAVSAAAAQQLYACLHAAGVTCISVGQTTAHLCAMHTALLLIGSEGDVEKRLTTSV